jgi:hypothetical protein
MNAINTRSSSSRARRAFEARRPRRCRHSCPRDRGMWRLIVDIRSGSQRCERPRASERRQRRRRRGGSRVVEGVRPRGCAPARSARREAALGPAHRRTGRQAGGRRGTDSIHADARAEPAPAPGNDACTDTAGFDRQAEPPSPHAGRGQARSGPQARSRPAAGRKNHARTDRIPAGVWSADSSGQRRRQRR